MGFAFAVLPAVCRAQFTRTFQFQAMEAIPLEVGSFAGPQALTLADVNRDGDLDIVAIDNDDFLIHVLIGRGDGTFGDPRSVETEGSPTGVAVADVTSETGDGSADIDGNPDVVISTEDGNPEILIGDGDGNFSTVDAQDLSDLVDGIGLVGLALADFDRNGRIDMALLDEGDEVYFICNDAGNYAPCADDIVPTEGEFGVDIAAGDFDGDSNPDVAVLNSDTGTVTFIYGGGNGQFPDVITAPARAFDDNTPIAMTAGLVDSGNVDDVVIVNEHTFGDLGMRLLRPVRRTQFNDQNVASPSFPTDVALADIDADGAVDAILTARVGEGAGGPVVISGDGGGGFIDTGGTGAASRLGPGLSIAVGNLGGDLLPDLVIVKEDGDAVQVALNRSNNPTFTPTIAVTATPTRSPSGPPTFNPGLPTFNIVTMTPSRTHTASPTVTPYPPDSDDDGCAVRPSGQVAALEPMLLLAALLLARARHRAARSRPSPARAAG